MTPAELVLLIREHNARHEPADKKRTNAQAKAAFDELTRGGRGV